ncbi:phospholipid phosphatase 3-like isoform X1 [Microcebus murinus]|uniref:phospholipid phosphatase 3-like isoform X1 n=1 Tax=Microcebus murinus TaxID=30608 RepID=UPI003F6B8A6F
MALSPKVTTKKSLKTWDAQCPSGMTSDTDATSAHTSRRKLIKSSQRVVTAPPKPVVLKQSQWPADRRRTSPPASLSISGTAKMLVALDLFCLMLVSVPTLLSKSGLMAPHFQGFFCNDTTIRYPRVSHYVVEDSALITIGFLISVFTISLGEMIYVQKLRLSPRALLGSTYVVMVYKQLVTFIFGSMASFSLASITKMTTGRLRPHFLAVCLPDPASFNCESGYITNYTCTGHPEDVLNARKSFYSEQASLGMYCMVYLVLYVQVRPWGQKTSFLRPTFQFLFLSLALVTGYIRTLDYWHHPYDVVIGFLQGALMAFWVAFYINDHSTVGAIPKSSEY